MAWTPDMKERGFTLVELLIVVAIIGIIAAIAVPSLLRARVSANEAATRGDIRTVMSSQPAYHSANQGHYGVISCLAQPWDMVCIPGYPATGPTFLDYSLAALTVKSGYTRAATYLPAPGAQAGDVDAYCVYAQPVAQNRTGVTSFGGDASAVIFGTSGAVVCCRADGIADTTLCPPLK